MYPGRPLTPGERHFLGVFLGSLPLIYLGFWVGLFAADLGSTQELTSIFRRSLVCAAPAALLAVLTRHRWLLPSLIYGYGFSCGYTFTDSIGASVTMLFVIPAAALTEQGIGTPSQSTHPELLWLLIMALWLAAFIAFFRCRYSHSNECA